MTSFSVSSPTTSWSSLTTGIAAKDERARMLMQGAISSSSRKVLEGFFIYFLTIGVFAIGVTPRQIFFSLALLDALSTCSDRQ
jgi:hypothetical protein